MIAVGAAHKPVGIFTLHDVLHSVTLPGLSLDATISAVMSLNPLTLPPNALALAKLPRGVYHDIHNLTFEGLDGTTQVDHVVVSR